MMFEKLNKIKINIKIINTLRTHIGHAKHDTHR